MYGKIEKIVVLSLFFRINFTLCGERDEEWVVRRPFQLRAAFIDAEAAQNDDLCELSVKFIFFYGFEPIRASLHALRTCGHE